MCSHTVAIKVEKDGYTFKNQFTTTNYPSAIHAPFLKIGLLPRILAPQIGEVITLPYEKYRLDLKTILSVAVLQQSDGYTRYLVPLQDGIIINHPDDLLHGEDFTSCILDQRTVVTFDSTWATPRNRPQIRLLLTISHHPEVGHNPVSGTHHYQYIPYHLHLVARHNHLKCLQTLP